MIKYRILLIHNPLSINPVTWLSFAIRMFTLLVFNRYSANPIRINCFADLVKLLIYNHIAVEVELLGRLYIIESTGKGVNSRSYERWATASNRTVLPIMTEAGVMNLETFHKLWGLMGETYGFIDLLKIACYFILRRFFGIKIKVKNGKGLICQELADLLLNLSSLLTVPNEYQYAAGIIRGDIFKTFKK